MRRTAFHTTAFLALSLALSACSGCTHQYYSTTVVAPTSTGGDAAFVLDWSGTERVVVSDSASETFLMLPPCSHMTIPFERDIGKDHAVFELGMAPGLIAYDPETGDELPPDTECGRLALGGAPPKVTVESLTISCDLQYDTDMADPSASVPSIPARGAYPVNGVLGSDKPPERAVCP